ncbi:MAG: glycoside hydrolase family 2 protein [Armatimonadetes bacterium]|nr:glycoside hydrolase family 2 protein [Armatimonadota bacterium]
MTVASGRQRLLMDPQWRFHLGEVAQPEAVNHGDTYMSVKAGHAGGPAGVAFDDSAWRELDLPHDWLIEQPYDPRANVSHGFRRGDVAWYRKTFGLPTEDLGRRLWLEFDGVFRDCTVWLNGHLLGRHPSGYTSFHFDITDVANYGGPNVVAVRVDARAFEGWWYEGAGIYRHVWLTKTPPVHVGHWGVYVAPQPSDDLSHADVVVTTTVVNDSDHDVTLALRSTVVDCQGNEVSMHCQELSLPAGTSQDVSQSLPVRQPQLWDLTTPYLYLLRTAVSAAGTVDEVTTPFGIRHIRFDPEEGFLLNGRAVKLKGTCNHQDHAGVGIAVPDALQEFRIRRLLEMGSNAYRCAHNPPAPELLDACDRLGMLVMDENRHLSSSEWGLADLESMIRRDRNHPCIIMWSMANEEPLQRTETGTRIVRSMVRRVRQLDPTRPTIAAMDGGWGSSFSLAHDVQGCNYIRGDYDEYHATNPQHPILASEASSALTTRGIYLTEPAKGYMSAYDVNAPEWGNRAEEAWRPIAERPFMAGTFVWTGFDYRGEPTPYQWPCISSHFGIMDTCGFPKDNFYYYQAWWSDRTVLHILPHWNWPERLGETIPVWVHSNCEEVELFLNGRSLGRQPMERNGHLEWQVVYEPGVLLARGYARGEEVATAVVQTAGPAHRLRLTPDRSAISADGEDLCVITVSVRDEAERVVPTADDRITFSVSANARILGVGNGDPSSHEEDRAEQRRAFNGLCQVIVQSVRGEAGPIQVEARAPGLLPASCQVESLAAVPRPWVAALQPNTGT